MKDFRGFDLEGYDADQWADATDPAGWRLRLWRLVIEVITALRTNRATEKKGRCDNADGS